MWTISYCVTSLREAVRWLSRTKNDRRWWSGDGLRLVLADTVEVDEEGCCGDRALCDDKLEVSAELLLSSTADN